MRGANEASPKDGRRGGTDTPQERAPLLRVPWASLGPTATDVITMSHHGGIARVDRPGRWAQVAFC